ncbi:Uncharacterized protein dnm_022880 [Desulfonema magnum]|uniref:Uncharacterized protein n=1 Tax=Desulfonema magnum TaxID=45655 RepID=A0A975BJ43_9BACT|nr:Uncharacterized protein dnm_022880 [Desulfonema magnum]
MVVIFFLIIIVMRFFLKIAFFVKKNFQKRENQGLFSMLRRFGNC